MPPKGSKGKKGMGKALPPPVLEPPQLEPAQKEVDKTTNVKAKIEKKVVTTFNKQQKEALIEFLWQNEILCSKWLAGFKDVNEIYACCGLVMAQIMITIAQNILSPIVTYRNKANWFFMLVSERICNYQFITNCLQ